MAESSVDSCVCDPPYELGFQSRDWDKSGIAFDPKTWAHVLRVLKPGAYLLAFGGTRTFHRIGCAIEDAGFELRDSLAWLYGSGFPKSVNLGEGRGSGLKPAFEPLILARKPLAGTLRATVANTGVGALNIDACRVPHANAADLAAHEKQVQAIKARGGQMDGSWKNSSDLSGANDVAAGGRWPANLVVTHSFECSDSACVDGCPVLELDQQSGIVKAGVSVTRNGGGRIFNGAPGPARPNTGYTDKGTASRYFTQTRWDSELDNAAPFLYCGKASTREREAGLDSMPLRSAGELTQREDGSAGLTPRAGAGRSSGRRNPHPTVKPIALLRWLTKLVTPVGGVVLDPFGGVGSGAIAAVLENRRIFAIELNDTEEEPFVRAARLRVQHWLDRRPPEERQLSLPDPSAEARTIPLFGGLE